MDSLFPSLVILSTRFLICRDSVVCWSNLSLDLRMSWQIFVHSSNSSLLPKPLSLGRGRLRDIVNVGGWECGGVEENKIGI
jgi:hypothetical protein